MSIYKLNNIEAKTRKYWIILTFILYLIYPFEQLNERLNKSEIDLMNLIMHFTVDTISSIIGFMILYYCAYRKHGTVLLSLILIITPLAMCLDVFMKLKNFDDILSLVLLLVDVSIIGWWYLLGLKLRKINKKIQLDSIRSTDSYALVQSILQQAHTLEELNNQFGHLIRKSDHDSSLSKHSIKDAYTLRKKAILAESH